MKKGSGAGGVLVAVATLFALGFLMVAVLPLVLGEKNPPHRSTLVIVNKTNTDLAIDAEGSRGFAGIVAGPGTPAYAEFDGACTQNPPVAVSREDGHEIARLGRAACNGFRWTIESDGSSRLELLQDSADQSNPTPIPTSTAQCGSAGVPTLSSEDSSNRRR